MRTRTPTPTPTKPSQEPETGSALTNPLGARIELVDPGDNGREGSFYGVFLTACQIEPTGSSSCFR
jgi:hypothetical protein